MAYRKKWNQTKEWWVMTMERLIASYVTRERR